MFFYITLMNSSAELWFLNILFHSICTIVSFASVLQTFQVFKICIKLEQTNKQTNEQTPTTAKSPKTKSEWRILFLHEDGVMQTREE